MNLFVKERKIISKEPFLFLTLPFALVFMIFIIIVRPFILIRFGLVHTDRIGHFATNTELSLCEKKKNNLNSLDLFYFPTKPCNDYLGKIIKNKIIVLPKILIRPFCLIVRKFKKLNKHVAGQPLRGDYDICNLFDKFSNQLDIDKKDILKGDKFINKINPQKKPITLLIVRDSSYLKRVTNDNSYNYHSHRDDDIHRYKKLILFLIKRGFYVIRMGKIAKKPLNIRNKNFYDYPFSKEKSDFLDIYLAYKSKICISNLTGYDAIPTIFRKNIIFIDPIPFGYMSTHSKRFFSNLTKHYSLKKKRFLTTKEIFDLEIDHIFEKNDFKKEKIILKKSSPFEIVKICEDALNYFYDKKYSDKLSNKFSKIYKNSLLNTNSESKNFHGKIKSKFSNFWFKKYKFFII
ncbi:TIGR04372 family glycosyltransferase [Candidatus Pelagibacter sp.]|nr:TIGR04372 family glycosyltransferase [Candidatus Pelagibacter sp.]